MVVNRDRKSGDTSDTRNDAPTVGILHTHIYIYICQIILNKESQKPSKRSIIVEDSKNLKPPPHREKPGVFIQSLANWNCPGSLDSLVQDLNSCPTYQQDGPLFCTTYLLYKKGGSLPETNPASLHLKMDGWNMKFPFGMAYVSFRDFRECIELRFKGHVTTAVTHLQGYL